MPQDMKSGPRHQSSVASPCINVCDIEKTSNYCIGCGRSLDEIARWASATDEQRSAIKQSLPERLVNLKRLPSPVQRLTR
jgi:predicted Fe-S protein YdhL (DUF1289 family)